MVLIFVLLLVAVVVVGRRRKTFPIVLLTCLFRSIFRFLLNSKNQAAISAGSA